MTRLVVGLGNPGPEYERTRHNAGFLTIDLLAENLRATYWKDTCGAKVAVVRVGDDDLVLAKPQTFMNLSGSSLKRLIDDGQEPGPHVFVTGPYLEGAGNQIMQVRTLRGPDGPVREALEKGLAQGAIRRFDTLEDLARAYEMPVPAFLEEVARFNGHVEKQRDPDFECKIFPDAKPNTTAPFYAARLWPRVHHTMGGLAIDERAQVQGFDLRPVPGLYAAGEVTGGVHGAVRLGSVAMADCVVFGRIAGANAARERPWS